MISAIFFINQKGDIILNRFYRDDVSLTEADSFRLNIIASKNTGSVPPIQVISGSTFQYIRYANIYFVAVTRTNLNPALVFEFLYQMSKIFRAYFGDEYDEDTLRNHMTLIYELMDETMDFGYPQNCSIEVLQTYINLGTIQDGYLDQEPTQLTSQITGQIDWRREGIRYKKNEVWIDILESVNLLFSATGNVLRSDVSGQVVMKSKLSGWPECKFGLNDKLIMDKDKGPNNPGGAGGANRNRQIKGVEIDDCTFHRCVRLGKFDADRTITFIPPDGQFELMRYRVADNIHVPFRVIPAIQEEGRTRVGINVKITGNFSVQLVGVNLVMKIPVPNNTAKASIKVNSGRAKFEPERKAIVWRMKKFQGGQEAMITADVTLMPSSSNNPKPWIRPPISLEFQLPMLTASGVNVRFLRVYDKSGYTPIRWVRYITKAGEYQIRI